MKQKANSKTALKVPTVALVGSPNSGKTTLYNWLTNSKSKAVNYPGATVEYALGPSAEHLGGPELIFMDTPGTYSLFPKSTDEEVTLRALYENTLQGIILVVDGTQLERHLMLAQQVLSAGFSCLVAVTMPDLLKAKDIEINTDLLSFELGCPVLLFDGQTGKGLQDIFAQAQNLKSRTAVRLKEWTEAQQSMSVALAKKIAQRGYKNGALIEKVYEKTAQIDSWLLGPLSGVVIFFAAMTFLFSSIFWIAKPFMDLVDWMFEQVVDGILAAEIPIQQFLISQSLSFSGHWVGPSPFVHLTLDFLAHGLVASLGAVLVFVPQIFILFLVIGFLEGTGYLARAASLIDKPFSKLGLSGRSFVPVLSGFACAVPAIMATRNISSQRDRWVTTFMIPLMTCSARLPVYALLLSYLLADYSPALKGLCLALLYFGSLLLGSLAAAGLNKVLRGVKSGFFLMELPLYRMPKASVLLHQSFARTKSYVLKAGPVILIFAILIWAGTTFPNSEAATAQERLQTSYLATMGHSLEPVLRPLGVDWRVGVGMLAAFAAREVFVSSLALVMNVGASENSNEGLLQAMRAATQLDGSPVFTLASVMGLIVFFMIALQCMSTFSMVWRETRSLKFALSQLVLLNGLAYGASALVVFCLR